MLKRIPNENNFVPASLKIKRKRNHLIILYFLRLNLFCRHLVCCRAHLDNTCLCWGLNVCLNICLLSLLKVLLSSLCSICIGTALLRNTYGTPSLTHILPIRPKSWWKILNWKLLRVLPPKLRAKVNWQLLNNRTWGDPHRASKCSSHQSSGAINTHAAVQTCL
jgi:hypothetical protein